MQNPRALLFALVALLHDGAIGLASVSFQLIAGGKWTLESWRRMNVIWAGMKPDLLGAGAWLWRLVPLHIASFIGDLLGRRWRQAQQQRQRQHRGEAPARADEAGGGDDDDDGGGD